MREGRVNERRWGGGEGGKRDRMGSGVFKVNTKA